jgi:hypothetical protein
MVDEVSEDEEAQEEQMEEQMEKQQELQSELYDNTPSYGVKDDLWTLFKWVIGLKDSTKVGNLGDKELGMLVFSVRSCQDIALQSEIMGHDGFKDFWRKRGENILASSLSKNMAQQTLFVSQTKKKTTEKKLDTTQPGQQPQQQKKGFFKKWGS